MPVGVGRFELPTSTSRTWRANRTTLHPDYVKMPPKVLNLPHLKPKTLKTKSFFLSLFLFTAFACYAFPGKPVKHRYNFSLKGLHDTKCYLGYYYGDKSYVLDSSEVDPKG